ncbi:hypothetical protein [Tersicoccus phoenicis]|nr:hypothetical protein [Tersicoccus phoenicis]
MTGPTEPSRYDLPLAPDPDHDLSVDEVRVLWSFIHGDIMNSQFRARLRAHHGPCERHAWAYAVTEIELWEQGAGRRGGHQPFDVAVLYTDLLEEMSTRLRRQRRRRRDRILRRDGTCLICDDVRGRQPTRFVVTHAGFDPAKLAAEANRMRYTIAWLRETAPCWSPLVCPDCTDQPTTTGAAIRCRPHLVLHHADLTDHVLHSELDALDLWTARLRALLGSMTAGGRPSTPEEDAAWVAAVAWFNGWRFPLTVVPPIPNDRSRDTGSRSTTRPSASPDQ